MAKKKNKRRSRKRTPPLRDYSSPSRRDILTSSPITSRRLYRPYLTEKWRKFRERRKKIYNDRRSLFNRRQSFTQSGTLAHKTLARPYRTNQLVHAMRDGTLSAERFSRPDKVSTCIRREQRREVLFAKGGAGKGKRIKRPKYNESSKISCRRH